MAVSSFLRPMKMYGYNEYHFHDRNMNMPGRARLRDAMFLRDIGVPMNANRRGWTSCPFDATIKRILTPQNNKVAGVWFGSWRNWDLKTLITITREEYTMYKVALQQKYTGEILMFHVDNCKTSKVSRKPSMVKGWFVYNADMTAPSMFWEDLKARL